MSWVSLNVIKALWWRDIVRKSTNWCLMTSHIIILPLSEKTDDEVASELPSQHLGEEIDVGDEGSLQNNWDVRGIEEFDGIWLSVTSHLFAAE